MKNIFEKRYNIHQKKTIDTNFKFPFELIPKNLQRHFVRGFIDGDGYIGNNGCKIISQLALLEQVKSF